jgi:hypothetical protein
MLEVLKEWLASALRIVALWLAGEIVRLLELELDELEARVVDIGAEVWRRQPVYGVN